jgi:hypothetical protein
LHVSTAEEAYDMVPNMWIQTKRRRKRRKGATRLTLETVKYVYSPV